MCSGKTCCGSSAVWCDFSTGRSNHRQPVVWIRVTESCLCFSDCQLKKFSENVTDESADRLWGLSLNMAKVELPSEEE